jgi:large repetitive protein
VSTSVYVRLSPRGVVLRAAVLAVAAAGLFAVTGGQAFASHVSCGDTITADTTLDRDLVNCPVNGLVIGANHITLDLNGHTIDGDGAIVEHCPAGEVCDVGIDNGPRPSRFAFDDVTIKGGSVREFAVGVVIWGVHGNRIRDLAASRNESGGIVVGGTTEFRRSVDNRVERSSAVDDGDGSFGVGILMLANDHSRVEHSSVSGNDDAGIVVGDSTDIRVVGNSVRDQPFAGISLEGADRTLLTGNRVVRNGDDILVSGQANRVVHNLVADAFGCEDGGCGAGIAVESGSGNLVAANHIARVTREGIRVNDFDSEAPLTGTVIRDNLVRKAGVDGIAVATEPQAPGIVTDTLLAGNIAIGAADDGIDVDSRSTTLTGNIALHNGDLGIEAVTGVTDGGGNKARGNGNPAQCTNIACISYKHPPHESTGR